MIFKSVPFSAFYFYEFAIGLLCTRFLECTIGLHSPSIAVKSWKVLWTIIKYENTKKNYIENDK
jgi:hypothetical protein